MGKRNVLKKKIETSKRQCDHPGCSLSGEFPAPKSRHLPESFAMYSSRDLSGFYSIGEECPAEKYWFCLAHVREYNSSWNFFSGMTAEEMDKFQFDAISGHRVSWEASKRTANLNERHAFDPIFDAAWRFRIGEDGWKPEPERPELSNSELAALKMLEVTPPATKEKIKSQYRKLVKIYHPDRNKGNKKAEEKIRAINHAYSFLKNLTQYS